MAGKLKVTLVRSGIGHPQKQHLTLRGLGLPGRLVERIRKRYGDTAAHVVSTEPFRLAEEIRGVGFRTADALARHQGLWQISLARLGGVLDDI